MIEWSQDGQAHTLRRKDVAKLLDRRRHRRRQEELLLLEDAKKLLGVTYGYLYDAIEQGILEWVKDDKVSKLRKADVLKLTSKVPEGYVTKREAKKLLHTVSLKKLKQRRIGRFRIYKKSDIEKYLPPGWVNVELTRNGETRDAISLTRLLKLIHQAIADGTLPSVKLVNARRYILKADLLRFFEGRLGH